MAVKDISQNKRRKCNVKTRKLLELFENVKPESKSNFVSLFCDKKTEMKLETCQKDENLEIFLKFFRLATVKVRNNFFKILNNNVDSLSNEFENLIPFEQMIMFSLLEQIYQKSRNGIKNLKDISKTFGISDSRFENSFLKNSIKRNFELLRIEDQKNFLKRHFTKDLFPSEF